MASRNQLQTFQTSWNQTSAWAQSKGISYNSYYPIYQMDSQRLLSYSKPMSQAERERAVLAAGNPNAAQQATPSTASSPFNIVGNTVTDLRNIFTGIGDIAIHPLHNGLIDSVKNTFDLMDGSHHLTGGSELARLGDLLTSTVASWIPGVADIGTVMKSGSLIGGVEQLMEHPVSSWLDVLPLSKLAGGAMLKDANLAERAGLTPEQAAKGMTLGRLAKNYMLNSPTKDMGPRGVLTVGDKLHRIMGNSAIGTNPAIADAAQGLEVTQSHFTTEQRMLFADAHASYDVLNDAQKEQLHEIFDPTNTQTSFLQRMDDPKYDEATRQAARDFWNGPARFHREEELAVQEITNLTDPTTGRLKVYTTKSHADIVDARDAYAAATKKVTEVLPQFEKWAEQTKMAEGFLTQHADALQQARQEAAKVDLGIGNVAQKLPGARGFSGVALKGVAAKMFGEGGFIDSIVQHVRDGQWEDVLKSTASAEKRLQSWGARSVDAADHVEYQAVLKEVQDLHTAAKAALEVRKRTEKAVYGKAQEVPGIKAARDATHKAEKQAMSRRYVDQVRGIREHLSFTRQRLEKTKQAKARSIRETANAEIQRQRAWKRERQAEINHLYGLEKRKTFLHHLEAGENARQKIALMRREIRAGRLEAPKIPADSIGQLEQGLGVQPGSIGTKEGVDAELLNIESRRLGDLARHEDTWKQAGFIKDEATIKAEMQTQLRDLELAHTKMREQLKQAAAVDRKRVEAMRDSDMKKMAEFHGTLKARHGQFSDALREWQKAQKDFAEKVWKHPPDVFSDAYFDTFVKHLSAHEGGQELLGRAEKLLSEKHGWSDEMVARMRTNQGVLRDLVQLASKGLFEDYGFSELDQQILDGVAETAKNEIRRLADDPNVEIAYIPHVSSVQLSAEQTGSYGIKVMVGHGIPSVDAASGRVWDMDRSRFDVMASFSHGVKQILDRDATVDYVTRYLAPRTVSSSALIDRLTEAYGEELSSMPKGSESYLSFVEAKAKEWGMVKFDPQAMFGFSMPKWQRAGDLYLDGDLVNAVKKLTARGELPTLAFYDKATRLFRYSILGLSPRYTAHILFGGSFLLALRSSPMALTLIKDAHDMVKSGQSPEGLATHATQLGTTEWELRNMKTASHLFHTQGGKDLGHYAAQEHIEVKQGVKLAAAKPIHWLKALADINLHFTSYVVNMQRAVAYLDGAAKAEKIEGMTAERAMYEGMHHANEVMGDLRRMSPFERNVARSVMPFYGWTKHILQYVLSFPGDHPWRAMMLANMAEFDMTHQEAGLPSRYQFLFFLGTPDKQGNVTALDARAMNPLRDVANYATLGGFISSLNPVITSTVAMVDPQITFGANTLYPNLTYDQFYGIETAGPQGNLLTAAQGIVPQIGAIQSAMKVAGQRQGMSDASLVKNIFQSLNIPMLEPQHINLKQEAARTALARYQVTKQLAGNAWQTGDFGPISNLGSVPDPRNADYETPVSELQALYAQLQKQYPGVDPASVAPSLPSARL